MIILETSCLEVSVGGANWLTSLHTKLLAFPWDFNHTRDCFSSSVVMEIALDRNVPSYLAHPQVMLLSWLVCHHILSAFINTHHDVSHKIMNKTQKGHDRRYWNSQTFLSFVFVSQSLSVLSILNLHRIVELLVDSRGQKGRPGGILEQRSETPVREDKGRAQLCLA